MILRERMFGNVTKNYDFMFGNVTKKRDFMFGNVTNSSIFAVCYRLLEYVSQKNNIIVA